MVVVDSGLSTRWDWQFVSPPEKEATLCTNFDRMSARPDSCFRQSLSC